MFAPVALGSASPENAFGMENMIRKAPESGESQTASCTKETWVEVVLEERPSVFLNETTPSLELGSIPQATVSLGCFANGCFLWGRSHVLVIGCGGL